MPSECRCNLSLAFFLGRRFRPLRHPPDLFAHDTLHQGGQVLIQPFLELRAQRLADKLLHGRHRSWRRPRQRALVARASSVSIEVVSFVLSSDINGSLGAESAVVFCEAMACSSWDISGCRSTGASGSGSGWIENRKRGVAMQARRFRFASILPRQARDRLRA